MNLNTLSETFGAEDMSWLGSAHGVDNADSITLDGALLGAVFATGEIKSGTVLAKVTATGRYAAYDDAASNGQEVAVGFLIKTVKINRAEYGSTAFVNAQGALLWTGEIVAAKLPVTSGAGSLDTAGRTDLAGRFFFV